MKPTTKKAAALMLTIPFAMQTMAPVVHAATITQASVIEQEPNNNQVAPEVTPAPEVQPEVEVTPEVEQTPAPELAPEISEDVFVEIEKITFEQTEMTLNLGDKVAMQPIIEPANATNQKLSWETNRADVVSVDEFGVMTAIGAGIATITAMDDEGIYAQVQITVTDQKATTPLSVPVTGFEFTKKDHTMKAGSELKLEYVARIKPFNATTKNLVYTSSDETIATVNNDGEVIAHKTGAVVITATTVDGGFSDQANITVVGVPAENMYITKTETMLTVGLTEQLHTEFTPENATNKNIIWQTSDESVATVSAVGEITATGLGTAIITGIAEDGGAVSTMTVNVVEEIDYTIDTPYTNINWETTGQLKADLHAHTNETDGKQTLQEQINIHQNLEYDILGMTDHDNWVDPFNTQKYPGLQINDNLEIIRGNEYSGLVHHMNGFFLQSAPFVLEMLNQQVALNHLAAEGGIGHINHPGRYYAPDEKVYNFEWYQTILRENDFLVGVEVINRADRYSGDRQLWDRMLTEMIDERDIWGFANSDAHRDEDVDTSYNMMLIEGEYTEEKMRAAMESGEFYFTAKRTAENNKQNDPTVAPPVIDNIVVDNNADTITIEGENIDSIEWISSNSRTIGTGEIIDLDDASSSTPYVRAVIKNAGGVTFTQPFKVSAVEDMTPEAGFGPEGDVMPEVDAAPEAGFGPEGDVMPEVDVTQAPTVEPESGTTTLPNTGEEEQAYMVLFGFASIAAGIMTFFRRKKTSTEFSE
ncbi:MAG: Ig-like domain-containing protein [Culicoidibacterales bacterium]